MKIAKRGAEGRWVGLSCVAAGLVAAMVLGVAFGTEPLSISRAFDDASSLDRVVMLNVRLPRALLAGLAGGGLAIVGAAFQAVLRNPLAEPFVLGVSGGAAFGATIAILLGLGAATFVGASATALFAFGGGLSAMLLVHALARGSTDSGMSVLLAGVVVNATASAAITFLKTLSTAAQSQELLFWLTGFLDVPSTTALVVTSLYVAVGSAVLLRDAGRLNLLALGDEAASHLGVDVGRLQRRTLFACSFIVGAVVSVTGLIGFVGLVVPHALRRIVGPDARILLPASLVGGAGALILCDLASRLLFRLFHTEPPVGAVTAIVGGPVFLLLLRSTRRSRG